MISCNISVLINLLCFYILYQIRSCEALCAKKAVFMLETWSPKGYRITPINIKEITEYSLPFPYNTTEIYNELQKYRECQSDFKYLQSEYQCKIKPKPVEYKYNLKLTTANHTNDTSNNFQCFYTICKDDTESGFQNKTIFINMKENRLILSDTNETNSNKTNQTKGNNDVFFSCDYEDICGKLEDDADDILKDINIHIDGKFKVNETSDYKDCKRVNNTIECDVPNCDNITYFNCTHERIRESLRVKDAVKIITWNFVMILIIMACFLVLCIIAMMLLLNKYACSKICYRKHVFYVPPDRGNEDVRMRNL